MSTTNIGVHPRSSAVPNVTPLLPRGALTLLVGDPGIGKSLLAIDFAARISNNSPPLPHPHTVQPCVLDKDIPHRTERTDLQPALCVLNCHEDPEHILQDRLYAAGANPAYIHFADPRATLLPENGAKPSIYHKEPAPLLKDLNETLDRYGKISLLVLDPLSACLGISDNAHPSTVRNLLNPLLDFAHRYHIAILGICHLTKSRRSKNPLHNILGSIAYPAVARSILYLTTNEDPHLPNLPDDARLLIPQKNNLVPITHAYAFTLAEKRIPPAQPCALNSPSAPANASGVADRSDCMVDPQPEPPFPFPPDDPTYLASQSPSLHWEKTPITTHPLLPKHTPVPTSDSDSHTLFHSQLDLAKHFLQTTLAAGPVPSAKLLQQSRQLGIAAATLARARLHLTIKTDFSRRTRTWIAFLPTHSPDDYTPPHFQPKNAENIKVARAHTEKTPPPAPPPTEYDPPPSEAPRE